MALQTPSWGRYPAVQQQRRALYSRHDALPPDPARTQLPVGLGRSYGDSALNHGGVVLDTCALDRYIAFDPQTGVLDCEAGASLAQILQLVVPRGWFLPVTPGTRYVTVGGAIANDVHGKNHHRAGSFGRHVLEFELLRSDGQRLRCSPQQNLGWFAATVGGLGLTGLIVTARLQLLAIPGPAIEGEILRFGRLAEYFELARESDRTHEYTVAWIDCLAGGAALGRGLLTRGNPSPGAVATPGRLSLGVPFTPPLSLVTGVSVRAFNALYYARQRHEREARRWHYQPFFYPLDGIRNWNRMYGPRGFFQYQCVVPAAAAQPAIAEMLGAIARAGQGSFLAVLKSFGELPSPGLLSFARPGATLAIDFANGGTATLALLQRLDDITLAAGGAVYPAKDARMSAAAFQRYFPRWREFAQYVDPRFSSSFWRRVTGVSA